MSITHSKLTKTGLLTGETICRKDAERLMLECIERLGERCSGLARRDVINLLRQVIELGVDALAAQERTCTLEDAGWASIEARGDCRSTTLRDLRYYLRRMLKLSGVAQLPLRAMSTAQCRDILQRAFGHSKSSYVKGRAVLSSIFSYGIRQEWCDANPVSRIEVPRVVEKPIAPLTPDEVERLKETACRPEFRDMRFSLSLMLYGGIRPTEVSRLQAGDISWEECQIIIRPHTSKTGGGRAVPLRGMLGISQSERCIPRDWRRKWRALRRAAGFTHWQPDVCRHTFATYHAAMYRNLPELQLEMGHRDTSLLRSRYMIPTSRKAAELFWKGCM